jgi:ribosome-associated protein
MSQDPIVKIVDHVLDEMKAQNIIKLDVRDKTSMTDSMYICTGRSSRHVSAVADELFHALKKAGYSHIRVSGMETGEWALIDCGDVIVHVMQAEARANYNLEELWSQFPPASTNHA